MKLTIIESPFANADFTEHMLNIEYARRCMRDSLMRGEAPFASHLIYPQPFILDENNPKEREWGINAGFAWGDFADLHCFYTDRGWSRGMLSAYDRLSKLASIYSHRTPMRYSYELRSLTANPQEPPKPIDLLTPITEPSSR